MKDNISSVSPLVPLGADDYGTINAALDAYRINSPIPCTACRYCMDCPSGVDIPKVFEIYNNHKNRGKTVYLGLDYRALGTDHQADRCTKCRRCTKLCPQELDIPTLLDTIDTFVKENALEDIKLLRPEDGVKIVPRL
jgi:predicted aldo/keto reductase-like oxidoreductase